MGNGKEVKEDERFIVGMEKGEATISKIVEELDQATKRHCCDNLEKISTSRKRFPNCKT